MLIDKQEQKVEDPEITSMRTPASQQLRLATEAVHLRLHKEPHLVKLLSPDVRLSDVYTCLLGFSCFYTLLDDICRESGSDSYSELKPYLHHHRAWLAKDTTLFHTAIDERIQRIVTSYENTPQQLSKSSIDPLGVLYVTEGSLLGGEIIARCLTKNLRPTGTEKGEFFGGAIGTELSLAHFTGHGKALNEQQFSELKVRIDRHGSTDTHLLAMQRTAIGTFTLLENIFKQLDTLLYGVKSNSAS